MHRIAAIPGGWNPQNEGVVFIDQTPAPIVIITAADTDIQTLAQVWEALPTDFPELRVTNILALQQQLTIDTYAEDILAKAAVIIVRLLGGVGYWPYGLEVVQEIAGRTGTKLAIVPGDSQPDPSLFSRSTLPLSDVNQIWRYFTEGGVGNLKQLLYFLGDRCLGLGCEYQLPQPVPKVGIYEYRDRQADLPPSPQFWGNMMPPSPQFWGNMMQRRDGLGILGVSFEITAEIYARPIFDVTGCCAGWG
jgi:cobaltochelatase CobN